MPLALVLHSHMPYVEGFGTWPFGEEWLFEAIATSYAPLTDVLEGPGGDRLTLSVTPVLGDQLLAPGVAERFEAFCRELRAASHALDREDPDLQDPAVQREVDRSEQDYLRAAASWDPHRFLAQASWTSSATHAVLPLLATDEGVRLQLGTGVEAHRARTAGGRPWAGGLWLPECAHDPALDHLLEAAGVHATCVDLTDVLGEAEHLRPLRSGAGPLLVPIDRRTIELVWAPDGYPSRAGYRDYVHRSPRDHHPWAVGGGPYDRDRGHAQAAADAEEFVRAVADRAARGLVVCALDTELLGHWWFEGPVWLREVLGSAQRLGVEVTHLDDALAACDPVDTPAALPVTTWGTPRTLWTWSGPQVADLAFRLRAAELRLLRAGDPSPRAVRELLALQSSDWAFLRTRDLCGTYQDERADGHEAALDAALRGELVEPELRGLAPLLA